MKWIRVLSLIKVGGCATLAHRVAYERPIHNVSRTAQIAPYWHICHIRFLAVFSNIYRNFNDLTTGTILAKIDDGSLVEYLKRVCTSVNMVLSHVEHSCEFLIAETRQLCEGKISVNENRRQKARLMHHC